ncbi:unnamed protein product [marine sediment metagenome]|uniref:Predicted DNA-binding protein ribbon-helix-helix domain-containing protein n=1 Tax=marine sediment metagenome TaxID=412755 RepID=X0UI60_9ZZZZ
MKFRTLRIKKEQLERLRKLSKAIGLSQGFLVRMAIDELIEDKEKLKKKLFPQKGK